MPVELWAPIMKLAIIFVSVIIAAAILFLIQYRRGIAKFGVQCHNGIISSIFASIAEKRLPSVSVNFFDFQLSHVVKFTFAPLEAGEIRIQATEIANDSDLDAFLRKNFKPDEFGVMTIYFDDISLFSEKIEEENRRIAMKRGPMRITVPKLV